MSLVPLQVANTSAEHHYQTDNSGEGSLEPRAVAPFAPERVLILLRLSAPVVLHHLREVVVRPNGGLGHRVIRPHRDIVALRRGMEITSSEQDGRRYDGWAQRGYAWEAEGGEPRTGLSDMHIRDLSQTYRDTTACGGRSMAFCG